MTEWDLNQVAWSVRQFMDADSDFARWAFYREKDLGWRFNWDACRRVHSMRIRRLGNFPKLPAPIHPLEDGHLRYELEKEVSDGG